MNTPAHVILSGLIVGAHRDLRPYWGAILLGAVVPDAPMLVFYAWERWILGVPEMVIWRVHYEQPGWQAFFDALHSLPLAGAGALLAWWLYRRAWLAFFLGIIVHGLADLPLHHHDAHRHFWPISDWRFQSPVSYWDPRFYGDWFGYFELALVLFGAAVLGRWRPLAWRWMAGITVGLYAAFLLWASVVWG